MAVRSRLSGFCIALAM
eukprot:s6773_g1.t1